MKALYDIRDMFCEELEKLGKKKELSPGSLETIHKLTDTIKNIDKILMLEESGYSEDGYSRDGNWRANMEGSYGNRSSYGRSGKHYVRGHYSRDGGGNSHGGRSYGYSRDSSIDMLEGMMKNARSEREREAIQRCIREMEEG